jgi:hypothetical protein
MSHNGQLSRRHALEQRAGELVGFGFLGGIVEAGAVAA